MARVSSKMREVIKRCSKSSAFFIENFCKIQHPTAGVMPFRLFGYQKNSLLAYMKHRYTIYRKCRQCGISTLSGAYALWLAMFRPHTTVLIVSKRDLDAKGFLKRNIKFPYDYLPKAFKDIYGDPPITFSEHKIEFSNGSTIQSLTSAKDTLRANSSTLNIIDESAFMPDMEDMWAGGQPTLIMGGSVIVISTCNGKGNWYHNTWEDAEGKFNDFHPISINWWEMDWVITFQDKHTGQLVRIAPTDNIRKTTPEEEPIYGPYWSPWLEEQLRALRARGEGHLFKQEILADFLGSGNTVVEESIIRHIETTRRNDFQTVRFADYLHPATQESLQLDFEDQLWVWNKPVKGTPDVIENGKIIVPGKPGHTYVIGADPSTGEAADYTSIQVFDIITKEQVAELNIKALVKVAAMMTDFLGRWYNGALVVPESTGIGRPFIQDLTRDIGYANVWRRRLPNGKRDKKLGFPTTAAYKPDINKALQTMLGEDGYQIYSHRFHKQVGMYVHLTKQKTGSEPGSGNHDDLIIAAGLALLGAGDALQMDVTAMVPTRGIGVVEPELKEKGSERDMKSRFASMGGLDLLMPMSHGGGGETRDQLASQELEKFSAQLGGLTKQQAMQFRLDRAGGVVVRKHTIKRGKYSR